MILLDRRNPLEGMGSGDREADICVVGEEEGSICAGGQLEAEGCEVFGVHSESVGGTEGEVLAIGDICREEVGMRSRYDKFGSRGGGYDTAGAGEGGGCDAGR